VVRAVARDGSGATLPEPHGGKGIGRVTFTADGRMQSMVCDAGRRCRQASRATTGASGFFKSSGARARAERQKNTFNLNLLRGGDQRRQGHLAERNSDFWSFLRGSLG
jgi:hypothetical protein